MNERTSINVRNAIRNAVRFSQNHTSNDGGNVISSIEVSGSLHARGDHQYSMGAPCARLNVNRLSACDIRCIAYESAALFADINIGAKAICDDESASFLTYFERRYPFFFGVY